MYLIYHGLACNSMDHFIFFLIIDSTASIPVSIVVRVRETEVPLVLLAVVVFFVVASKKKQFETDSMSVSRMLTFIILVMSHHHDSRNDENGTSKNH